MCQWIQHYMEMYDGYKHCRWVSIIGSNFACCWRLRYILLGHCGLEPCFLNTPCKQKVFLGWLTMVWRSSSKQINTVSRALCLSDRYDEVVNADNCLSRCVIKTPILLPSRSNTFYRIHEHEPYGQDNNMSSLPLGEVGWSVPTDYSPGPRRWYLKLHSFTGTCVFAVLHFC